MGRLNAFSSLDLVLFFFFSDNQKGAWYWQKLGIRLTLHLYTGFKRSHSWHWQLYESFLFARRSSTAKPVICITKQRSERISLLLYVHEIAMRRLANAAESKSLCRITMRTGATLASRQISINKTRFCDNYCYYDRILLLLLLPYILLCFWSIKQRH